jgi:hypothetical protein
MYVTLAALAAVVLTGCRLTGGGWMAGADGGRATFGFDLACRDGWFVGEWTYHDKAAGLNLHGTVTPTSGLWDPFEWTESGYPCEDTTAPGSIDLPLVYTARPCRDVCEEGHLYVSATDTGRAGPDKGDYLSIEVFDGPAAFYENSGVLRGGNLTVAGP